MQSLSRILQVYIGGRNVAKEYYKMPEKTAEEFFDDDTGRRWFKTGDIGQVLYFLNNASIRVSQKNTFSQK